MLLQAVVLTPGWQLRQGFVGSIAPVAWTVPLMKQPAAQAAELQTSPVPHAVPLATLLHAVVLVPGWQLWHGSFGSSAADA
jgi:hypothetical protein